MLQTKGLRFLTILAAGMLLATAAPGQDDERSAFRDKQFDAVRAEMTKITTAIQENVKGFLGSADQPRKRTRAAIEAFHEEVMKLYAQLDKPRADIDKLHDEIQAQYDQCPRRGTSAKEKSRIVQRKRLPTTASSTTRYRARLMLDVGRMPRQDL
jgi:septal ring factor EnvC (AmiA/AmiB activator)